MPLDLVLSKASTVAELDRAAPVSLASLPPPPRAKKRPDGALWLEHDGGEPWLVVAERGPNIVLSTSYSSRRFLRNFADMFDLALRLSEPLGARVFEEAEQREVTRANVGALLAPEGRYVGLQARTFHAVRAQIEQAGKAPLEYPVGPIDLVDEYFVFSVRRERPIDLHEVQRALAERLPEMRVEPVAGIAAMRITPASVRGWRVGPPTPTTKVLVRAECVQIWGAWSCRFSELAPATLDVAEAIEAATAGQLDFLDRRCDRALREALRARQRGLGVELYLWMRELQSR